MSFDNQDDVLYLLVLHIKLYKLIFFIYFFKHHLSSLKSLNHQQTSEKKTSLIKFWLIALYTNRNCECECFFPRSCNCEEKGIPRTGNSLLFLLTKPRPKKNSFSLTAFIIYFCVPPCAYLNNAKNTSQKFVPPLVLSPTQLSNKIYSFIFYYKIWISCLNLVSIQTRSVNKKTLQY